jgi:1,4-dihydroxy-2-naphthoate octaprenyltransferase
MTLAVRLGRDRARNLYAALVLGAYALLVIALAATGGPALGAIALASLPLAIGPMRRVRNRTDGPSLNEALAQTGALLGAFSLLLAIGLLLAA